MRIKLFLACACAAILPSQASAQAQVAAVPVAAPTAADFGARPFLATPLLSPDGKSVAARGLVNGREVVVIVGLPVAAAAMRRISLPADQQLEWVRWAGSRRLLISLSKAETVLGTEVRMTRLAMLDLDTGKQSFVGPREQGIDGDDLIHVDPEGRFVLLSTQPNIYQYPSVFRVDLATGKSAKVVDSREDVWNWYADDTGTVRGGLGIRDGKWWLLYRPGEGGSFERTRRRDLGTSDSTIDRFVFSPGSDTGFAVASGTSGRFGLYRYDFRNETLGEKIYEHPVVDIDDFDLDDSGKLRGVWYTDDKPEVTWFDPELKKLQGKLDRAIPGALNRVVSSDRAKTRFVVWSGSASRAGTYLIYDRATNTMSVLAEMYDKLADKPLAAMEPVRYQARDGLEIRAYLTLPLGRDPKNLPLIVMPHGGPFARDAWGYDAWVQYLASRGYAVLQPNFRGSTGFGGDFVKKGVGEWGRGMQDDIDDGVKWLAGRGIADAKRVCIMGASFGGYAAMWAAVRNPEIYRCAISFAGISDVGAMLRYDRRAMSATRYFRDWRARVQGDRKFELDQISPIKTIAGMTVPILIAHGADDKNVPMSQSKQLHEGLQKIGRAHEYVIYPKEGHGLADAEHATDFLVRVGAFLDKHNPAELPAKN